MQVYRELRVLTARPTAEDEAAAPHAVYGVLPASEACSAARWLALAEGAIKDAWAQGRQPLVTGGTGLYLKTLMEGLSPIPPVPPETRAEAERLQGEEGEAALAGRDAVMHARLKPGDTQRRTRALEVWLGTGKSLAWWQEQPRIVPFPEARFSVKYVEMPRDELYRRCDARFTQMLEQGAEAEVRALLALELPAALPAMRAVGVPELGAYIRGETTLEKAMQTARQATRNYAKRQLTWFRNQRPVLGQKTL